MVKNAKKDPPISLARRIRKSTTDERRSTVTRAQILGAVYELISEHGVESLTMRQVAERCDISTGTINYHFKNKENLLAAALTEAYSLPSDWSSYKGSPEAQLRRIASSYVFRDKQDRWWFFWINFLAYSTRHSEFREQQKIRYTKQLRFWAHLISDGIHKGEFNPSLEPFNAAREILTKMHGLVVLQTMQNDNETREYVKERIELAIDALKI